MPNAAIWRFDVALHLVYMSTLTVTSPEGSKCGVWNKPDTPHSVLFSLLNFRLNSMLFTPHEHVMGYIYYENDHDRYIKYWLIVLLKLLLTKYRQNWRVFRFIVVIASSVAENANRMRIRYAVVGTGNVEADESEDRSCDSRRRITTNETSRFGP